MEGRVRLEVPFCVTVTGGSKKMESTRSTGKPDEAEEVIPKDSVVTPVGKFWLFWDPAIELKDYQTDIVSIHGSRFRENPQGTGTN